MSGQYHLNGNGSFVIEDYNHSKVFANFFPGVAGLYGIPMWAFYVNRGQGIASFGIESKDKSILEFQPANRAYRLTSIQGFRTFLKVHDGKKESFYEPFANNAASVYKTTQVMKITSHDLTIEEINTTLGVKITVNYFTMPDEPYAALVRRVSIENISKKKLSIQCVDGLPALNPYGLKDWLGKHLSRTVEAWVAVHHVAQKAPFYQFKVEVADTPQVTHINEGNFYFAFDADTEKLLDPIVEAACVFGHATDFLVPEEFLKQKSFTVPAVQQTSNRTPSAFVFTKMALNAGKSRSFIALAGFAHDLAELKQVVKSAAKNKFIESKRARNEALINGIKDNCQTHSASAAFNQYCGQTFLDNVLRGGLSISLQTADGPVPFNVYSRKHGDLERDYNFFTLSPTFLSQGNGNYRDVNQNRRNDIFFNQDVKDSAVVNFFNLLQADGYNPLVIKGATFVVKDEKAAEAILDEFAVNEGREGLKTVLLKGFMPGDLLKMISRGINIKGTPDAFLTRVIGVCQKQESAEPGEGFWTDHWTYNLDLVESYLGLYPEGLKDLLLNKKDYSFFYSEFYVLPRDKRYLVTPRGVRQYHSLEEHDKKVAAKAKGYKLRVHGGEGDVYHTNLLVKLVCLLANKSAALDPSGIGVEMEANKPNWYDALNGLPGLLGSSISETFEVKRFAAFTLKAINDLRLDDQASVNAFSELVDFVEGLSHVLVNEQDSLKYWQKANDLKEHYRQSIRYGIEGAEKSLSIGLVRKFLNAVIAKCEAGIAKAKNSDGTFATYFYHEVTRYDVLDKSHHGERHARALEFKRHDLPLFLEGFVHALRVEHNGQARDLFKAVKKSKLYDKALGMYKVNTDLSKQTEEIGRTRIFPAGWLENESVWLHMEYKYLLEVLRSGLYEEFFQEIKTCFVPFLDPAKYGRSILENSSFIASSAHEDKNLHGQGFVARLSGSTAELLHMWLVMNVGLKPFSLNTQGQLSFNLNPILPSWLFTDKATVDYPANTYAFKFLGKTTVVYHNAKKANTFGKGAVKAQQVTLSYVGVKKSIELTADQLVGQYALDVRAGKVARIDVVLA